MEAIKIEVTGNIARVIEKPAKITSGTVGLPVEFTFDSQWEGLDKIAVFQAGYVRKHMVLVVDATAVPMEVLARPGVRLNIGVYGVNEDGSVAIPTIWTSLGNIREGAVPGSSAGSDIGIAKKYYDQAMRAAGEAKASAQKAEADAGVAETAAGRAEEAAGRAEEAAQQAKQPYYTTQREKISESHDEINTEYIWSLYRTLGKQYPGHVQEVDYSIGDFEQHAFVISTGEYPTDGYYTKDEGYGADPHIKKPKYLLLSGIHGIERKTVFSAYRFIQDVLSGHNVPRDFKEGAIICVMPVGNPDGFDKFTYENEDGVNINRDFDEIEKGTAAKQTQAIANWLAQNKDAELFIDFHNSSSVNEIVAILGCSDNDVIDSAKRVALRGIDLVIPFWKTIITDTKVGTPVYDSDGNWQHNEEKDVIFSYSASISIKYNLKELAIGYATIVLGIPSIAIETLVYCGDYYPELATEPDYQPQAIALGAEALGNILLEFYRQGFYHEVGESMKNVDSKLDTLLGTIPCNFRKVTGTFTPTADVTEIHLPDVPSNAQIVEIVPTGTPSKYTTKRAPVTFFTSAKTLNKGEFAPPYNAWAEYDWYGLSRSEALADFTNGFSVSWSDVEGMDILVFEKDMKYKWTAYCWDD